ncbi:UNVERIFIED_CONTAM: hypothetical protein FKN15_008379 [Acipenser sinensis]
MQQEQLLSLDQKTRVEMHQLKTGAAAFSGRRDASASLQPRSSSRTWGEPIPSSPLPTRFPRTWFACLSLRTELPTAV